MDDKQQPPSVRKTVERQAIRQLTTLTSLLAGFAYLSFVSVVDKEVSTLFSLAILIVTALTILMLVLASIVGALLTVASEITVRGGPIHRIESLWVGATKVGILLFLTTVALLPYRVSLAAGIACSVLAGAVAVTIIVTWSWIQRLVSPEGR
jgi:hypothetical protein